jgi:hypothetical protein
MNILFTKIAVNLAGAEQMEPDGTTPLTLGRILANTMASQTKGDALKMYDWAKKLYAGEPLNLDRSDCKTMRDFIDTSDQITILAKAQLLEILDEGKD